VIRILAVGDSFTFGVGAEENETIPYLMQEDLIDDCVNAEVINCGFGSFSPLLHFMKMRDEYLDFKPDLVVYFFDFSDLADDWRYERQLVLDENGDIVRCDPAFLDGKRDWWKTMRISSKACSYIYNKVVRTIDKIRKLGLRGYISAKLAGKRAKAVIIEEYNDEEDPIAYDGYLMIRGRDKLTFIRKHFERTASYLLRIKELLDAREIPMVLVAYPYGIHVGAEHWGEGRIYWGFEKRLYDDDYAFRMLEDLAAEHGMQFIDLLPVFLEHSDEELFFNVDGHFTPAANRIAASTIVNTPEFRRLLDSLPSR